MGTTPLYSEGRNKGSTMSRPTQPENPDQEANYRDGLKDN
jgi:hypothetical protein